MRVWLVREHDGTSFSGAGVEIRGYVLADTAVAAKEAIGEPENSWNSFSVTELELFKRYDDEEETSEVRQAPPPEAEQAP